MFLTQAMQDERNHVAHDALSALITPLRDIIISYTIDWRLRDSCIEWTRQRRDRLFIYEIDAADGHWAIQIWPPYLDGDSTSLRMYFVAWGSLGCRTKLAAQFDSGSIWDYVCGVNVGFICDPIADTFKSDELATIHEGLRATIRDTFTSHAPAQTP